MTPASAFNEQASAVLQAEVDRLRGELSFASARALPEVTPQDIVVAGKEVQLTVFRQDNLGFLAGQVLVTVQIARHGLGGIVAYKAEKGIVYSPEGAPRDATESELRDSGA